MAGSSRRGAWRQPLADSGDNSASSSQKQSSSSLLDPDFTPPTRYLAAVQGWQSFSRQSPGSSTLLTLSQEARNTERHIFGWGNSTRLRDKSIQFVSAGNLKQEDLFSPKKDDIPVTVQKELEDEKSENSLPADLASSSRPEELQTANEDHVESSQASIIERVGRLDINPPNPSVSGMTSAKEVLPPKIRDRSPSLSSATSEEIILFAGRKKGTQESVRPANKSNQPTIAVAETNIRSVPVSDPSPQLTEKPVAFALDSLFIQSALATSSSENVTSSSAKFQKSFGKAKSPRRKRGQVKTGKPSRREIEDEEEALIQDYIDNMDKDIVSEEGPGNSGRTEHFRYFGGEAREHVKVQIRVNESKTHFGLGEQKENWSSDDVRDLIDLSTSDGEVSEVGRVHLRRERPSGLQYLVSTFGKEPSDPRWILSSNIKSQSAKEKIQAFEDTHVSQLEDSEDDDETTSDSEEDEALDDLLQDMNSEDDENRRIMARTSRMTDEQIARALAKQEEIGMGSAEVLLFDGKEEEDDDFGNRKDFIPFSLKSHISSPTRSKRNQRKKDNFPSAEAFADALDQDPYGGFDVMDFDRPSLRPKRKGRKSGDLPFELEDEELAAQLQHSWSNDRAKKASKKQERQEMRLLGLLGSKATNGRIDLKTKYEDSGMDADQIRTEIRTFLIQESQVLALAPMAPHMRASVHRLAKALNLKSHSQGKGDDRFPILTKIRDTAHYSINNIWEVDALMNQRRFFPKNTGAYKSVKKGGAGPRVRRGGGGVAAGASYMDGDVVGASAPEIGAENRGRAMLEKMGWTSGMGIGKVGNKGSTEVIKHVVKNTKAGLG